jgi:CRP-like cAMP-binding protein
MEQQLSADEPPATSSPGVERRKAVAAAVSAASLRVVPMLADLGDDELGWIAANAERLELGPGDILFVPGEPANWMFFALEGVLQARREQLGPSSPVFVFRGGDVGGTIPFSRMTTFAGTGRAVTSAVVIQFPKSKFPELLQRVPVLTQRFVSLLADRVRETRGQRAQRRELLELGVAARRVAHAVGEQPDESLRQHRHPSEELRELALGESDHHRARYRAPRPRERRHARERDRAADVPAAKDKHRRAGTQVLAPRLKDALEGEEHPVGPIPGPEEDIAGPELDALGIGRDPTKLVVAEDR